ncbi:MAG TPA: pentapeptide repeat-containing protein [Streptosporangiaceae bacterium]|nr:pentapeptide repeat-containing protein [Streptosporangiaceae bacterium]
MEERIAAGPSQAPGSLELRADCGRCFSLCCVVPAIARSADFAIDKPAGQPCPNLAPASFDCSIHDRLRRKGFGGCAAYDCFGAGQHVAQGTFGGRDWRAEPELAGPMFAAFGVMRQLHELAWYLRSALQLQPGEPLTAELTSALEETARYTGLGSAELAALDVAAHRDQVNPLLVRASELLRSRNGPPGPDLRGANLIGRDLTGKDLRRASLRGAQLIGARLKNADLRLADLTGADLRGADLTGADLREALFLTQAQLDSAARGPA